MIVLHELVGVTILLATLIGPVYAGFRGGRVPAIVASVLLALYTLRFSAEPGEIVNLGVKGWQGALVMLALGLAMGLAMAQIKVREDALKRALADKARALEERNRSLADANATLESFAYVVSHDLKEPVRAIDNYLLATEEEYGSDDGRTYLARARQANQRLIALLRGLLDYSRVSAQAIEPYDVRLDAVLDSDACRTMFEGLMEERHGELAMQGAAPVLRGDEVVLAQLFGNLIVNAIKHNDSPEPRVWVRMLGEEDGRAIVAVDDNGRGFPDDVRLRLEAREPLRGRSSRSGFGLLIAERALRRLEGDMRVERSPEGGARVRLSLPAGARTLPAALRMLQRGRQ